MFYGSPQEFFRVQMENSSVAYNEGYRQGKEDYSEIKYQEGYDAGTDYGFDVAYDLYFDARFNEGYSQGENDTDDYYLNEVIPGVQDTYEGYGYQQAYDEFFDSRYQAGYSDAQTEGPALISYIPGILGVVMGFFFQIASIEFAGVSILDVLVAVFGITVALLLFKIFLGGK